MEGGVHCQLPMVYWQDNLREPFKTPISRHWRQEEKSGCNRKVYEMVNLKNAFEIQQAEVYRIYDKVVCKM